MVVVELFTGRSLGSCLIFFIKWGTGTPKDRDEVNKREVWSVMGECVI